MKKILTITTALCFFASLASAQLLIGGKAGGMGGAGVANVSDLAAAYYNPAALIGGSIKAGEAKVSLGAEYTDPTELSQALSKASNPAQFIADNYTKNLSFDGNLDGVIGFSAAKVGISVIPVGTAIVNKAANTVVGTVSTVGQHSTVLTLGQTYSVPFLPAALDVGLNAKYITAYLGSLVTAGTALSASGTTTSGTGTGLGIDIGALTRVDIPFLASARAGIVARDLMQSVTYSNKSQTSYINYSGGTATVTNGAETVLPGTTTTYNPSYAVGIAGTIPSASLGLAADLEFTTAGTNTHIGVEYPLLLNALLLRAGTASGPGLSKTTLGVELNLAVMTLAGVLVRDANNSAASAAIVDLTFGW